MLWLLCLLWLWLWSKNQRVDVHRGFPLKRSLCPPPCSTRSASTVHSCASPSHTLRCPTNWYGHLLCSTNLTIRKLSTRLRYHVWCIYNSLSPSNSSNPPSNTRHRHRCGHGCFALPDKTVQLQAIKLEPNMPMHEASSMGPVPVDNPLIAGNGKTCFRRCDIYTPPFTCRC